MMRPRVSLLQSTIHVAALAVASILGAAPAAAQMSEEIGERPAGMDDLASAPILSADDLRFFESKIRPILIANCYGCHSTSSGKSKGSLRLDTREATLKGGESGPAVVPGDTDSSLLIRAVRYHDSEYEMPPAGKLRDEDIALLEQWVAMGAPDPRSESEAPKGASPGTAHRWTAEDIAKGKESHWSYRPIVAPEVPKIGGDLAAWVRTPIDAFIADGLAERGLTPAEPADRRELLRRASFDLVGLPPSVEEIERFEKDASPDAFARAVDRMLASPQFGERWGRHWLDVARYAESSGKEANTLYPHAWRYRDYVIESFNEGKPFDEFLVEQIAGDLLPAKDSAERAEQLVATGYLAIGAKSHNVRGRPQFQMDLADEQIDALTQGMLGLTVACARCHDHKFDPIPQKEYYALAGIFLSTETRYGTFEAQQNNHPAKLVELPDDSGLPLGPKMATQQVSMLVEAEARAKAEVEKANAVIAEAQAARRRGEAVPANIQQQIVRARATRGAAANVGAILDRFDEKGEPTMDNLVAMGVVDKAKPVNAPLLDRGEIDKPGALVPRGVVELVSYGEKPRITKGSGRLELAEWIADERNPLTARVWANRVWLHLFGKGLVPTPDNFGMSGQAPTHPELLDHLATRLIALDWNTKALIREIMLSRAYAMSSEFDASDAEIDPDNAYLWRMPKQRLEAEAIRDAMLSVAGLLDPTPRVGSPINLAEGGMRGPQVERMFGTMLSTSDRHRSVYLPIVRDRVPESLEVFDFAEPSFVTGQRDATNVPTQALYLLNSAEISRISDAFARRVTEASDEEAARIAEAFRLAFGRKPTTSESRACRDFLDDFRKALDAQPGGAQVAANDGPRAGTVRERIRQRLAQRAGSAGSAADAPPRDAEWSALCQALLLSGEFRTID
ncbi:MAG: PSD1 and planctomycete cytochrome C domain-containing protein [Planctomycetaceae bacterium]|nr:PSD1 and planctomycete cytochrome C domain-containing protein [Planctomycetaceae bacterium]